MKAFRNMRIRSQLNLIVCVAAALLVLTMGAVYIAFDAIMTNMAEERFRDLADNGGVSVRTLLRGIEANDRNYAYILEKSGFPEFADIGLDMKRIVADAYASMRAVSEDMRGVVLLSETGDTVFAGADADAKAALDRFIRQDRLEEGTLVLPRFTENLTGMDPDKRYFAHVAPILQASRPNRAAGYLITLFDYSSIRAVLDTLAGGDERNLGLLLDNGEVLEATAELSDAERTYLADWFSASGDRGADGAGRRYVKYRKADSLALSMQIPETEWRLAVLVSRNVIKAPILSLVWIGLAILIAGAAILAIASVATIQAITGPVEGIVKSMAEIGTPQHRREIETPSSNEVGILATHINAMIRNMDASDLRAREAEKRLYEAELARMQMELSWFQSQINPHFLYNTLESIRSMAVVYEAEEISRLAVATAGIFRYATRRERDVALWEELECVKSYMTVMQLRFPDRYQLKIRVPDNCRDTRLYRMLLQPIVENCFKHGFSGKTGNGSIHIRAKRVPEGCRIVVTDNGAGISSERLETLRIGLALPARESGSERVGLANIHHRLQLGYGDAYGLSIDSRSGRWTRVILLIPG